MAVLGWQETGVAPRVATPDDGDLVDGIVMREKSTHQSVTRFVVGRQLSFLLGHEPTLGGRTAEHPIDRLFQVYGGDAGATPASGHDCSLVEHIRQVGT